MRKYSKKVFSCEYEPCVMFEGYCEWGNNNLAESRKELICHIELI